MKTLVWAACSALFLSSCMGSAQNALAGGSGNPAPNGPEAAASVRESSGSYVIGPADLLTVSVWKETALSGNALVRPDGMISVPLVGDIRASGLTPLQLSDQIADKLKKFVQTPIVSVVVVEIRSKTVNMLGEVAKKGPVNLTSGMTLLDAIGAAGGLTEFANSKKIYILRTENGTRTRIPTHYKQALKGVPGMNPALQPGDTIVVP